MDYCQTLRLDRDRDERGMFHFGTSQGIEQTGGSRRANRQAGDGVVKLLHFGFHGVTSISNPTGSAGLSIIV